MMNNKQNPKGDRRCFFCLQNVSSIDWKDAQGLKRYTSSYAKIVPRRRSGICAWHQRKLSEASTRVA